MKRRAIFFLLAVWLLPALACNLPMGQDPGLQQSVEATLAAQQQQTLQDPLYTPTTRLEMPTVVEQVTALPVSPPELPGLYDGNFHYFTDPGDTPEALGLRFGVAPDTIPGLQAYPPRAMLPAGTALVIPNVLGSLSLVPRVQLVPDSEVIYSPAANFDLSGYIQSAGGMLGSYQETIDGETMDGAHIVERVALETSINPRLLLAFLEYRSGWVTGQPANPGETGYPIGFYAGGYSGLYKELILTARQLTIGYYGWRSGQVVRLEFLGGSTARIDPLQNPGSAAVQYLFARLYKPQAWEEELYAPGRFLAFYEQMFPGAWERAAVAGPLLPEGLTQPALELPFQPGETWSLTGGPHPAWGVGSPWGGVDFAPAAVEKGCTVTRFWATASASGVVTRSERGVVAIDLDGDGFEGTGWVLVYLHLAASERIPAGARVEVDQLIGHPSCEGGISTGTHVHMSRKYNGEWVYAGEPLPFILSGWQVWPGEKVYSGTLVRDDLIVTARPDGTHTSLITR